MKKIHRKDQMLFSKKQVNGALLYEPPLILDETTKMRGEMTDFKSVNGGECL